MKSSELVRRYERAGWQEVRQTGNHKIFKNSKTGETVPVAFHGAKEVPKGLAKALLKKPEE